MKRIIALSLVLCLCVAAVQAGENFAPSKLTMLCPSAAGGAMDSNSRLLAPYLEKHLGKPVSVVNMGGSAGWVGWKYLHDAARDGSYVSYTNFPNFINGYLDPGNTVGLDKDDFEYLALYTSDVNVVACNKDEKRFTNAKEFFDFAKKETVIIADAGARTDDAVAVALMEQAIGHEFQRVHFQNSAEGLAAIYGGHIDAWVGNVSEVLAPHRDGEMIVLAILDKERSPLLPDVQTSWEAGVEVSNSSSRGVIAAKGIDPAAKQAIITALKAAMEDPAQLEAAAKQGVAVTPIYGDDFEAWIQEQDKNVKGIFNLLD